MCKIMKELAAEVKRDTALEIAKKLIIQGTLPLEAIAESSGLSLGEIKKIAEKI